MKNVYMQEAEAPSEGGGSLLSTAPEAAQTEQQAVDNSGPAVERPEWLLDKYMAEDRELSEAIAEQAKAYTEAQKMLGGFTGAPEAYDFAMPEGVEGEIDTELDAYQQFVEFARSKNMNQETAQGLFDIFVNYQNSMMSQVETDVNSQKEMLGPNADERIGKVGQWLNANLSSDEMSIAETMTVTADQIQLWEKVISMARQSKVPKTNEVVSPVNGFSEREFQEAVTSEQYRTDPKFRAEIRKKAAGLFS